MSDALTKLAIAQLRDAFRAVGTSDFFEAYMALFSARMAFGTFLMLRFDAGRPPLLLDHWIEPGKLLGRPLEDYIESSYGFDPFYLHGPPPEGGGVFRLVDIAPDRFFSSEYYLQYYRGTGLCDEVGLLAPLQDGGVAHLSLNRRDGQGPFRRTELQYLQSYAPLLLELLVQHCEAVAPAPPIQPTATRPPLADAIRGHARNRLNISLTRREAQIAGLVLQGHSNGSAARLLDIATETCKVHRRNLYRKLVISSQRDLFGVFKHLL
ncbi:LuxR C-terminal-related transcriptional regulator [Sulfitobacter aestuarii]|uniref:LuxR C-terminal-related transcriptional regulator n=1 Tax=Sulfitobacter aestuarii TaxID=2161676 RepID=A0ABW5U556_9RHOB